MSISACVMPLWIADNNFSSIPSETYTTLGSSLGAFYAFCLLDFFFLFIFP